MYFRFFLSVFFSGKVLAIPPGEIFWEITKPGLSAPNYLFGTSHHLEFRKDSLPAELVAAVKTSKVGLFEVIVSERTGHYYTTLKRRTTWLPDGETLSSYIGEERTQKLYSALQFALSQLDEEEVSVLFDKWEKFDLHVTSYEDFNSLRPRRVFTIERFVLKAWNKGRSDQISHPPILHKPQRYDYDREKDSDSVPDKKECLLRSYPMMDTYIEEVFSCLGKPVYSLENMDENLSLLLSFESIKIAAKLVWDSDKIIRRLRGHHSSDDVLHKEWSSFLSDIKKGVKDSIGKGYYLNNPVDTAFLQSDIEKTLSRFLTEKECSVLSDSLISQYAKGIISMYQLRRRIFSKGKKITETAEKQLAGFISETGRRQRDIFSLCFPEYKWPEDLEKVVERANQLQLDSVKGLIEFLVVPRDPKQAQNMNSYFEKGGAFAAVGFGHLSGVLRELKVQGYEIRRIDFSTPFKVPPIPSLYESLKTWGEEMEQQFIKTYDIYSNPAKVEREEENPHRN